MRDAKPTLPVIVLTARGEIEDRVTGLDAGAVDYLHQAVLAERAGGTDPRPAACRRAGTRRPRSPAATSRSTCSAARFAGQASSVRLSTTEFELLVYLLRNRGQVLSREQILRAVWGYDYDPGTNVVDVYVGYLRRKLRRRRSLTLPCTQLPNDSRTALRPRPPSDSRRPGGRREAPIVTVRSVGYRFDARAIRTGAAGQPALAADGMGRRRAARVRPRWFRRRLQEHGHPARSQIERDIAGDTSQLSPLLTPLRGATPSRSPPPPDRYMRAQP